MSPEEARDLYKAALERIVHICKHGLAGHDDLEERMAVEKTASEALAKGATNK